MNWLGFGAAKTRKLKTAVRLAEITERLCRKHRIHSLARIDPGECDPTWPCADLCPLKLTAAQSPAQNPVVDNRRH